MNQGQQYIHEIILSQIKMGFKSPETLEEFITEIIEEEGLEGEVDRKWAAGIIRDEYDKQMNRAEQEWGYPTDPYLLANAFDELRSMGIIAIHNAGYTTSDGESYVVEIERALREDGIQSEGYCFYHEQDLERALHPENPELLLAFQKVDNSDDAVTAEVGKKVTEVLRKHHLNAIWSGNINEKIKIAPIQWNHVFDEEETYFNFGRSYYAILDKYGK